MAEENVIEPTKEVIKETRASAISAAVNAVDKTETEDTKVEPSTKETATTDTSKEDDKVLAEQGRQLMLALSDPAKAPIVIKFLAEQAGYTKAEIKAAASDKEATAEITDDVLSIIKGEMGEEFDIISERLAKALNKILPSQIAKATADIKGTFQQQEQEKLQNQSAAAITRLATDFFGESDLPDTVSAEMNKFMDRVTPAADSSIKDFVEDAFNYAVGKLGLIKTDKKTTAKIERNRNDAASRLSSARVASEKSVQRDNSKPMTREEAIKAAIEAVDKGE